MRVLKRIYQILLIVWGILCLSLFVAEQVTHQDVLTRMGKLELYDFFFVFLCLMGLGVMALLIHVWRKTARKVNKGLLVLGWVGLTVIMLLGSLILLVNHAITTWYEFDSPDHQYSLVVRESTFLLLSDICPYERTSPLLVRKIDADLSPDDGWAAISNGAYKISWDKGVVTLSVDMNQNGRWDDVKLNMAEHGQVLKKSSPDPNGKPVGLDRPVDTNKKDTFVSPSDAPKPDHSASGASKPQKAQQDQVMQKMIEGLQAVGAATDYKTNENPELTYTAKGMPKLVLSSDPNETVFILYDRDSANGNCALYVLYQSTNNGKGYSDPEILEMYAYEYASGKVIAANRHAWDDVGTDEYRQATGE